VPTNNSLIAKAFLRIPLVASGLNPGIGMSAIPKVGYPRPSSETICPRQARLMQDMHEFQLLEYWRKTCSALTITANDKGTQA
jgi:hypothetical protein